MRCVGKRPASRVLWLARHRIRSRIDRSLAEFRTKGEEHTIELEQQLFCIRDAIETEGGPAPFVHREIWDKDFDSRLGPLGGSSADA